MASERRLKRDMRLKPRTTGALPQEKLGHILGRIYPEETVAELMEHLCAMEGGKEDG